MQRIYSLSAVMIDETKIKEMFEKNTMADAVAGEKEILAESDEEAIQIAEEEIEICKKMWPPLLGSLYMPLVLTDQDRIVKKYPLPEYLIEKARLLQSRTSDQIH